MKNLSWILIGGLCVAPILGQDEAAPYFALHSERTFGTDEQPSISLSATQVTDLEFRVYRIKDPVTFFRNLQDPHMFGGQAPKPPREKTPIEKFHAAKLRWHDGIRNLFRGQFSSPARQSFRSWKEGKEVDSRPKQKGVTEYALAPVLNPDQLVTTWKQTTQAKNRWDRQNVPVGIKQPGVYVVEAVYKDLRAYTILMVTNLAIITKTMPGRMIAFVANRTSGEPASNCRVQVWSGPGDVESYQTNDRGLIDVSMKQPPRGDVVMVTARNGDHVAVNSLYGEIFNTGLARHATAYIYTDRPVYRPGHTVHLKTILRNQLATGYAVTDLRSAEVEIQDPDGKSVFKKTLPINSFGTLAGDFDLPKDSALGYHSIQVRLGDDDERSAGFYVEDYKKPEYEVRVTAEKPRIIQGENIRATIDARYYYGEPVARAKVKYVIHRSTWWYPRYYDPDDREEYGNGGDADSDYGGQEADEKTGVLDADGKLTVEIPTGISEQKNDQRYRVEARVTDEGGREISGGNVVIATYGSFMVNIQPEQYVATPGQQSWFKIETRDYNDQPLQAKVHVNFTEWKYRKGDRGNPAGEPIASSADVDTDAQGRARIAFTPPHAGSFHALAIAKGPGPRDVQDTGYLWVSGDAPSWGGDEEATITIVPDKKEYKPGDTAKVLIVTGVQKSTVLVTTESRGIASAKVLNASGPATTVEVPVTPESVPNFYVSATFLSAGQFHFGQKRLRVPPVEKQLAVQVTSPKNTYKPGEPAQINIEAKDSAGRPVQGEFSVGVVDEAIYAIHQEAAFDMTQFFYGHTENFVATDNSLHYYFSGEAGKRRIQLAQGLRPTHLAQLKPERLVQPKIRKAFPDTILWMPMVTTNSQGKATLDLTYPDSLTAWRTTARGITTDTKVGSAVLKTIVRKDLMVTLAVPRFFTQGDEITIAALVRNYLPRDKNARVSLDVKGLDVINGSARDVAVPSKGEAKVEWRLKPQMLREAKLLAKALTDEESDAVELTLPINPQGVKMVGSRSGAISGSNNTVEFDMIVPPQMVAGSRSMEIRVTPSVAGALFGALDYLTAFPYGCTEQTMSSFLPNIVVSKALKDLGVDSNVKRSVLDQKIKAGLDRLYDYQHDDGGWGWWKTDDSQIFMTAYVLNGLAQARSAGQSIKPEVMERASTWLEQAAAKDRNLLLDLRAYVAYSILLADSSKKDMLDFIYEHQDRLSSYGSALFGLALEAAGDRRAAGIASQLEQSAKVTGDEASWPNNRDTLMDFYNDTTAETTAYALKLLVHNKAGSPLLDKAALWLLNHRTDGAWWYSTKQTAMVIYGLTDYLKASGELKPDFSAVVTVNGDEKLSRSFAAADALSPNASVIKLDNPSGLIHVRVQRKGAGRLYWNVREDYYAAGEQMSNSGNSSLTLNREYFKLVPTRTADRIVHELAPITGPVQQGDTLAVRLTVAGNDWRYVLIEDPIPSGTEFVTRDDLYELKDKPSWWSYWVTRREFHDDHAALFQTYFRQGKTDYVYLLKVVNPGRFNISPARVQPMYQPQYFATTKSGLLEVQ